MEIVKKQVDKLNKYGQRIPPIVKLSNAISVEPGYILGGIIGLIGLIILIAFGGHILTAVITVVYPAFKSIRALETKDTDDDDKVWLTYWVVFGVATLVDEFGFFILNIIPFYNYIKLLFFVWLMAPQTQGAQIVYRSILRPLLHAHKDKIERFIRDVQGGASSLARDAQKTAMKELSKPENISRMATAATTV